MSASAAEGRFGGTAPKLVIDKDESLRVSGEESLARELTERGMQGAVALRVVNDEKRREYQPRPGQRP